MKYLSIIAFAFLLFLSCGNGGDQSSTELASVETSNIVQEAPVESVESKPQLVPVQIQDSSIIKSRPMNLVNFLSLTYNGCNQVRPLVITADGTVLSIQGGRGSSSLPSTMSFVYETVEVSSPEPIGELSKYLRPSSSSVSLYQFVPVSLVDGTILQHGDFNFPEMAKHFKKNMSDLR